MRKTIQIISVSIILLVWVCQTGVAQWSVKGDVADKDVPWYLVQMFSEKEWNSSNFASQKEMEWFNDARYGMFIHFGLSTFIEKDLSWGMCYTRKAPDTGNGTIADSIWTQYPQQFVFDDFDAKEWVEIAKRAGMKYIVTVAKHHDGFHMWDTKYSDFKVTNTPFGRDYLKEISDACHEAGMKFGIYYSQRDWYHPDYAPIDTALIEAQSMPPYFKTKPGVDEIKSGKSHQKYIDYQFNVVKELCTNYGKVDVFWFDATWWGGMFTAEMWDSEKLTRMIHKLQPGVIINNRTALPGDFDTPEQRIGMHQMRPWESCISLSDTWSWSPTPVKSKKTLVNLLTATACGNGNTLLSWGPKWCGAYDSGQIDRLEEIGGWLKLYGHTIYNTKGGPWYPEKWGGSTYRGDKVFVHITGEVGHAISLPPIQNQIINTRVVTGGEVDFSQNKEGVNIYLQKANRYGESIIVELSFENEVNQMVGEEKSLSIFSDVTYGKVISKNAKFKLSSISHLNNPEHHNLLFGDAMFVSPFAFHTIAEKESYIVIDLGKAHSVTGVDIYNEKNYSENPGTFVLQVSTDGSNWTKVDEQENSFNQWEVAVTKFNAGIQLPGVKTRYVKIALKAIYKSALHLKQVHVYGNEI